MSGRLAHGPGGAGWGGADWSPGRWAQQWRERSGPGLMSTAAAGGTGAQADGHGGTCWGEQGAARAGWGSASRAGRSWLSIEEATTAGDEEAMAAG
jgi:hypothetical protein